MSDARWFMVIVVSAVTLVLAGLAWGSGVGCEARCPSETTQSILAILALAALIGLLAGVGSLLGGIGTRRHGRRT